MHRRVGSIPRIYCHYCRKERPRFLAYTCNHCKEIFCIDHIFPEYHQCPAFSEKPTEKQRINTTPPNPQTHHPPPPIQAERIRKPEEKKPSESTKEQSTPGKKHSFRITISLIVVVVLLMITSVSATLVVQQTHAGLLTEKTALEQEIAMTKTQIMNVSSSINTSRPHLEQINAEILELLSSVNLETPGDMYQLHDPIFRDVVQFIANDTNVNITLELRHAKEQGMQCAYVVVQIISSSNGEYELIGFNTVDEGMVYFEPTTDYQVFPVIGHQYSDCVQGTPYSSLFDDTITSIVEIW
ncbi:MAG: zinc finger AN1 domain-containing stress-associated protein [Candidatus Thermoplasmatota archaeon]